MWRDALFTLGIYGSSTILVTGWGELLSMPRSLAPIRSPDDPAVSI